MTLHCTMAEWLQHGPELAKIVGGVVIIDQDRIKLPTPIFPFWEQVSRHNGGDGDFNAACFSWARAEADRRHEKAWDSLDGVELEMPRTKGGVAQVEGYLRADQLRAIARELDRGPTYKR